MAKKWMKIGFLFLVVAIASFAVWSYVVTNVEQPSYQKLSSEDSVEMRAYPDLVVAEVSVKGKRTDAIKKGFRLLADYIFGNNKANVKIAMTAPVIQEGRESSLDEWMVRFVMPSNYRLEDLPQVNNERVRLKIMPGKTYAAITFSGRGSDANLRKHHQKLTEFMRTQNLPLESKIIYAFYNPPWTLPFLRRNEIWMEVDKR
jgi:effector-binding domain-containing protein